MGYLILTVYLLVGFQFGARLFFWGRKRAQSISDFTIPLIMVPLLWPFVLVHCLFDATERKAYFKWEE